MLHTEVYTFQTPDSEGKGLWISAKRYTTESSAKDTGGLTLLLTHCIGGHKEGWEVVIQRLFSIQSSKEERFRIREVWSFDRQNHGDSAILNAQALANRKDAPSPNEWALAMNSFVRSPIMKGHRLVAIGHSAGSSTWVLSTKAFPAASPPYAAIIHVESTITRQEIFERELEERESYMALVIHLTLHRRFEWPDKDTAFTYFSKRVPWKSWDPRAVRLLVDHGLQDTPDIRRGVTLKCSKEQEALSYDSPSQKESGELLPRVGSAIPVHFIWGERIEFMPPYLRDCLSEPAMNAASVSYVKDAGHMVVQEQPDGLAEVIASKLDTISNRPAIPAPRL